MCSTKFDLILSFASEDQEPADRIGQLPIFFTRLLTTTTPVGQLVALHMPPGYLRTHRPVFSSKTFHHVTFVEPSFTFPGGRRLVCPDKCGAFLNVDTKGKQATVTCTQCRRWVKVGFGYTTAENEVVHVPGHRLVQTPYPIPLATDHWWMVPKTTSAKAASTSVPEDLPVGIPEDLPARRGYPHPALPAVEGGGPSRPSREMSPVRSEKGGTNSLPSPLFEVSGFVNREDGDDGRRVEEAVPGPSSTTGTQFPTQQTPPGPAVESPPTGAVDQQGRVVNPTGKRPKVKLPMSNFTKSLLKKRLAIHLQGSRHPY